MDFVSLLQLMYYCSFTRQVHLQLGIVLAVQQADCSAGYCTNLTWAFFTYEVFHFFLLEAVLLHKIQTFASVIYNMKKSFKSENTHVLYSDQLFMFGFYIVFCLFVFKFWSHYLDKLCAQKCLYIRSLVT